MTNDKLNLYGKTTANIEIYMYSRNFLKYPSIEISNYDSKKNNYSYMGEKTLKRYQENSQKKYGENTELYMKKEFSSIKILYVRNEKIDTNKNIFLYLKIDGEYDIYNLSTPLVILFPIIVTPTMYLLSIFGYGKSIPISDISDINFIQEYFLLSIFMLGLYYIFRYVLINSAQRKIQRMLSISIVNITQKKNERIAFLLYIILTIITFLLKNMVC